MATVLPPEGTVRVVFYLDEEIQRQFKAKIYANGSNMADFLRDKINDYLEQYENSDPR